MEFREVVGMIVEKLGLALTMIGCIATIPGIALSFLAEKIDPQIRQRREERMDDFVDQY